MVLSREEESMAFEVFAFNNRCYFGSRSCASMVWHRLKPEEKKAYIPENKEHFRKWMEERKKNET